MIKYHSIRIFKTLSLCCTLAALASCNPLGNKSVTEDAYDPGVTDTVVVEFTSSSTSFGNITIGSPTAEQTLTLKNSGTATISNISGDSLSTPFAYKGGSFPGTGGTCTSSLTSNVSCTIVITYAPSSAVTSTESLSVSFTSPKGSSSISHDLSGSGITKASLTIGNHDFGIVANTVLSIQPLTVTNTGQTQATNLSGSGLAGDFSFVGGTFPGTNGTCSTLLNGLDSCTIEVEYNPATTGSDNDIVIVSFDDGTGATGIASSGGGLLGESAAPASLALTPNNNFTYAGTTIVGETVSQTFTITNNGGVSATALSFSSFTGAGSTHFQYSGGSFASSSNCGTTLAAGTNCTLNIRYVPTSSGGHTATQPISYHNGLSAGNSANLGLNGTAATKAILSLSGANPINFGNVANNSSSEIVASLSNSGGSSANITNIAVSGTGYSITRNGACSGAFAINFPVGSCTIDITYNPTSVSDNQTGAVTVTYDDGLNTGLTLTKNLTGNSKTPASLSVTAPAASPFDYTSTQLLVGLNRSQTFTVTNSGDFPATFNSGTTTIGDAEYNFNGGSFPGGGDCGSSLAAGVSCTFNVTYSPSDTIIDNTNITIGYHDGTNNQTSTKAITGIGTATGDLDIIGPDPFDFAKVAINPVSALTQDYTITNSGGVTVSAITLQNLSAPFSIDGASNCVVDGGGSATLAAGVSCLLRISYEPTALGAHTNTFSLSYFDGVTTQTSNTRKVDGEGVTPANIAVSVDIGPALGNKIVGDATTVIEMTLTNNGGAKATSLSGVYQGGASVGYRFGGNNTFLGSGGTCTAILEGGDSCTVMLTFDAQSSGAENATMRISYQDGQNAAAQTDDTAFSANSLNPAALALTGVTTFSNVAVGGNDSTVVTITNSGGVDATINTQSIVAPFSIIGGTCAPSGTISAGGGLCTLQIRFSPTVAGASGNIPLAFNFNDGLSNQDLSSTQNFSGTGQNPASITIPNTTFASTLVIGDSTINKETITVSNAAGSFQASSLGEDSFTGPFDYVGGSYPGGGDCGTTLAGGDTCTIVIQFTATTSGNPHNGSVVLGYNNGVSTTTSSASLEGVAQTPASLAIVSQDASDPYDFGSITITDTPDSDFTISNTGETAATTVAYTGLAAPFSNVPVGTTCTATLAGGTSCIYKIRYAPTTNGAHGPDTLELNYNHGYAAATTVEQQVQGTGLTRADLSITDLNPVPAIGDYGTVDLGNNSARQFRLDNSGESVATLTLDGFGLAAPYILNLGTCSGGTIAAGANCTITVTYTPTAAQTDNDTISINYADDAGALGPETLAITGQGDDPTFTQSFPFTTAGNYSTPNGDIVITGGLAKLDAVSEFTDADNSGTGFGGALSLMGLEWDTDRIAFVTSPGNNSTVDEAWTPQFSSIVHHLKLDESPARDGDTLNATIGANGTLISDNVGVDKSVTGKVTRGIELDGTGDAIDTGALGLAATAFTVSFWVKENAASQTGTIFGAYTGSTRLKMTIPGGCAAGVIEITIKGDSGSSQTICAGANGRLNDQEWTHVTLVKAAGGGSAGQRRIFLYIDGKKILDTNITNAVDGASAGAKFNFGDPLYLGAYNDNGVLTDPFNGTFDEYVVWRNNITGLLSDAQIFSIYEQQKINFTAELRSRIFDATVVGFPWSGFNWKTPIPFGKELPITNESTSNYVELASNTLVDDLVGLWHLNGNANDSTTNSNNGVVTAATVSTSNILGTGSYSFDGASSFIDLGEDASLDVAGNFTLSAWVKTTATSAFNSILGKWGVSSNKAYYIFTGATGEAKLRLSNDGSTNSLALDGTTAINDGDWHHVVAVYNGTNAIIYVDGEVDATQAYNGGVFSMPTENVLLGAVREGTPTDYFNGLIDEVAIWKKPLDADEILQLYQRGASKIKFQVRSCDDAACVGESWLGPDNSTASFFSEFNNNAVPNDGTGAVQTGLPSMSFTDFPSLVLNANRYFQYRFVFESEADDSAKGPELEAVTILPPRTATTNPPILNLTPRAYETLTGFSATVVGACTPVYQLSSDGGTNFLYYNSGSWDAATVDNVAEANTAAELTGVAMAAFPASGNLVFRAYLVSDGQQQCELDEIEFTGTE